MNKDNSVKGYTLLIISAVLLLSAVLTLFELSDTFDFGYRKKGLYGIYMLIAGIACGGFGTSFLLKADPHFIEKTLYQITSNPKYKKNNSEAKKDASHETLYFKSNKDAFDFGCNFVEFEVGTTLPVLIEKVIKSEKGNQLVIAKAPARPVPVPIIAPISKKIFNSEIPEDILGEGDLALWYIDSYNPDAEYVQKYPQAAWVGIIVAKILPIYNAKKGQWIIEQVF